MFWLTIPSRARADEPETWPLTEAIRVADNRCMTQTELVQNVQLWLTRPAIDRRIAIVVEPVGDDGLRFVVSRNDKLAAERRFHTNDVPCNDLRAAVALAIALSIDATVMQAILEPLPPAEPPPKPALAPAPRATPNRSTRPSVLPSPPPKPEERATLDAELHGLLLFGVMPAPAWGASVAALVPVTEELSLRLSGFGTAAQNVDVGSGRSEVAMVAGQLSLCLEQPEAQARLRGCFGPSAGRWSASGDGFEQDRRTALPWAALVAELGASVPLAEPVALSAAVQGYIPFVRPVLEERNPRGEVLSTSEAPPAGLGVSLGLSVRFQ